MPQTLWSRARARWLDGPGPHQMDRSLQTGSLLGFAESVRGFFAAAAPVVAAAVASAALLVLLWRLVLAPWVEARRVRARVAAAKAVLLGAAGDGAIEAAWGRLLESLRRHRDGKSRGGVPAVAFSDVERGAVDAAAVEAVRRAGVVVVRGMIGAKEASEWRAALERCGEQSPRFTVAQAEARQHLRTARVAAFLNRLWDNRRDRGGGGDGRVLFDPDRDCTVAEPRADDSGGAAIGNGAAERWLTASGRRCYRGVFEGRWDDADAFDPWSARGHLGPAGFRPANEVFRSFGGWLCLGGGGGDDDAPAAVSVLPLLREGVAYALMRPLVGAEAAEPHLCGAESGAGRLSVTPETHPHLVEAMRGVSGLRPGDMLAWHPDVARRIDPAAPGMLLSVAPLCPLNCRRLAAQKAEFLGAAEAGLEGRADATALSSLGRCQMLLQMWRVPPDATAGVDNMLRRCNDLMMGWAESDADDVVDGGEGGGNGD